MNDRDVQPLEGRPDRPPGPGAGPSGLDGASAFHDRVTEQAAGTSEPADLDALVGALHEQTSLPVVVEDRHGATICSSVAPSADAAPPGRWAAAGSGADVLRPGVVVRRGGRLSIAVEQGGEEVAVLSLVDPRRKAGAAERIALQTTALALALAFYRAQDSVVAERRLRQHLVEEVVAGTDDESIAARAQLLGYSIDRPCRVLVVRCDSLGASEAGGPQDRLAQAVRRSCRDLGIPAIFSSRGTTVVVIAEDQQPWGGLQQAVDAHLDPLRCRIGIGRVCSERPDYPRSYRDALMVLRLDRLAGAGGGPTRVEELGVFRLFAEVEDVTPIREFIAMWLGPLLDYDRQHRAELVETLTSYLESGGSYDAAAHALFLHRSTLRYRLGRIREIAGLDLGDADTRFNLQLATRALRALRVLAETEDAVLQPYEPGGETVVPDRVG